MPGTMYPENQDCRRQKLSVSDKNKEEFWISRRYPEMVDKLACIGLIPEALRILYVNYGSLWSQLYDYGGLVNRMVLGWGNNIWLPTGQVHDY